MSNSTSTYTLEPVSGNVVGLAIADLVIYALLFPVVAWIAWKHGKVGMVCWPIFVSYFGLRFVADIYQVIHRDEPLLPNAVVTMTNAGSIACLTLTLIGIVYEANMILPTRPKKWTEKIILAVTHLFNTGGIAIAMYGITPTATGGFMNQSLAQIGNCIMLFVVFTIGGWLWPTYNRANALRGVHPNAMRSIRMVWCALAAFPFHLIRLAQSTTYAFNPVPSLDPVMGSFATKLILVFGMQLCASLCFTAAGWLSMGAVPRDSVRVPEGDDVVEGVPGRVDGGELEAGVREDIPLQENWSGTETGDDIHRQKRAYARGYR